MTRLSRILQEVLVAVVTGSCDNKVCVLNRSTRDVCASCVHELWRGTFVHRHVEDACSYAIIQDSPFRICSRITMRLLCHEAKMSLPFPHRASVADPANLRSKARCTGTQMNLVSASSQCLISQGSNTFSIEKSFCSRLDRHVCRCFIFFFIQICKPSAALCVSFGTCMTTRPVRAT